MKGYKYCVASVNNYGNGWEVSFYAFLEGAYGLHRIGDWDDPAVLWYDTEAEAMKRRFNSNDCVLSRYFE